MLKLEPKSLDWALKHAINQGDTDIFPNAFEFLAIEHDWDNIKNWLSSNNVLQWPTRPVRRCLSPKHRYGFRISTQLDPIDFLIFAALVYEIGDDLESRRVSREDQNVFSWRFSPTPEGSLFDPEFVYRAYQRHTRELLESGNCSHIVVADIADFFPRLYLHRVENALRQATPLVNHAIAIKQMLAGWNGNISYGIPVGPSLSRLLAEITIDDLDKALLSEGATYVRYSDDFRILCASFEEAYKMLSFLALTLYENHSLTLQQHKTHILSVEEFERKYLISQEERVLSRLSQNFQEIIEFLELDNEYEDIDYDDLEPEQQEQINALNLNELLYEQLELEEIDIPTVRFVLRRLGQLDDRGAIDMVFANIDRLYPVFADVVQYLVRLRNLDQHTKEDIGARVLRLLDESVVSHLEFHRMWLLNIFTHGTEWDNENRFVELFGRYSDEFSQRKLILSLGSSEQDYWFRTRKGSTFNLGPWLRRAFLRGGSCLPVDERRHWYDSLAPRLDPLELAITRWARANPFGT